MNSWSQNGSQIASIKIDNNLKKVIFLEKNVLHYEEFLILDQFQAHKIE